MIMIMPANYSVIEENELSYIDGGWVDAMTSVKTLEKNIVEWIGGAYAGRVIDAFIGNWFRDNGSDNVLKNVFSGIGDLFTYGTEDQGTTWGKIFKGITNTVGVLGGIYVLGMDDDVVDPEDSGNTFTNLFN